MAKTTIILSVDEGKASGLVSALGKRDYIDVISLDREGRKKLRDCPACHKQLSKERKHVIDDKLLGPMLGLVRKMAISKTIILTNKENPYENIPPVEQERCQEFEMRLLRKAEALGLVTSFMDGSRKTYFTDALPFLLNEESHSPSYMITLDGEVVETGGSVFLDEVKFNNDTQKDRLKKDLRKAVESIPDSTVTFVKNGQMSLV